jgi:hypothetical protein
VPGSVSVFGSEGVAVPPSVVPVNVTVNWEAAALQVPVPASVGLCDTGEQLPGGCTVRLPPCVAGTEYWFMSPPGSG